MEHTTQMAPQHAFRPPHTPHDAWYLDSADSALSRAIDTFKRCAALPKVTSAQFFSSPSVITLSITTSTKSHERIESTSATQTHFLTRSDVGRLGLASSTPITPHGKDVLHTSFSPSGRQTVVFRKRNEGGLHIELFRGVQRKAETVIDEGSCKSLYTDESFGQPVWSADETTVAFVGEAARPQGGLQQFRWQPDFGEKFDGKSRPCIFLIAIEASQLVWQQITSPEKHANIAFGQPIFSAESDHGDLDLLVTCYEELDDGSRLGVVYCNNRPSRICRLRCRRPTALRSDHSQVQIDFMTAKGRSSRSPRICGPSQHVFLSNASGGEHSTCVSLCLASSSGEREVISPVYQPGKRTDFPGLYLNQMPRQCFLTRSNIAYLILDSIWRSERALLLVDLSGSSVQRVSLPEGRNGSATVQATDGHELVLVTLSSLDRTPETWVGRFVDGPTAAFEWLQIEPCQISELPSASLHISTLPKSWGPTESLILVPSTTTDLVVFPHGGPHSTFLNEFNASCQAFLAVGYAVVLVNYPGSLGFGLDPLRSLVGHIGSLDIDCVRAAAREALQICKLPSDRLPFYLSGSHGGFIGAHLSVRYPDEWASFVLRNPVTNVVSMSATTDIPDWCYAECGLPYPLDRPPRPLTPRAYEMLRKVSPMTYLYDTYIYAKDVSCKPPPTLLCLGDGDRRVPPTQGKDWACGLRLAGTECETLVFPDNGHALEGVEAEWRVVEAALRWFERYRSTPTSP